MSYRNAGIVLAAIMSGAALAAGAGVPAGATDRATYIVALVDPPLAAHVASRVLGAGAADNKRAIRQQLRSADSEDYLRQLDGARQAVVDLAAQRLGRPLAPRLIYRYVSNGMALELNAEEAQRVAALPGVEAVRRERVLHLHTDAGPQWIGADKLWTGQVSGVAANKGEGAVIGVIDTGINPNHPSFAVTGGDGYTVSNPRGHFYGLCESGQAQCNNKLIGIYDFTTEGTQGVDSVGHGSHVSGIAAGNAIVDALHGHTVSLSRNVSGVAPHANLIMYKGCNAQPIDSSSDGTCAESALVGAIDQATADQVDVINYSIGGDSYDPYQLLADHSSDAYAMFLARAAGVVVVASAGNAGPGANSLGEPGNSPWVIAAANASHNRRFANSIGSFTSGAPNPPATLQGQGYTSGYGPATIVYAGNFGNALCGVGNTEGVTPTGASNPFPPGTFHGEIVICDRGTYARVEKGYNVKAAGAGGYVLANASSDGESIISDDHFLPAVHLGYSEGQALKNWVNTPNSLGAPSLGTIAGVSAELDASYGDVLDASSSRGPYSYGNLLKPDITAPGDNILSAAQTGVGLALLSGTSMASPHVAGSVALVLSVHPDWSPAQVESALLGTALAGSVRLEDGVTLASPLAAGSGRIQPAAAVKAGLYLPLNASDYFAGSGSLGNPTAHGDLGNVNRTSVESDNCFQHCSFTRVVADLSGGGTWQISTTASSGVALSVTPNQFTLATGTSQSLTVNVDVTDPRVPGTRVSGRVLLHKVSGGASASDIALTVSVFASPGLAQPFQDIATSGPAGNKNVTVSGLVGLPHATFNTTSLATAVTTNFSLGLDPNPGDLYSQFPGTGKQFVLFPNVYNQGIDFASYGRAFIVEVASSSAQQTDLYAGFDSNGNGQPDQDEQTCHSTVQAGSSTIARCVVDLRGAGPGNVWALVDIAQGGTTNSVTLASGIPVINVEVPVGLVAQPVHAAGPGTVPAGAGFPLRLFWGLPEDASPIVPATRYFGAVMIDGVAGLAPNALGQSGFVPFALTRSAGNDDVADALEPSATRTLIVEPGETLQHLFVDVPSNGTSLSVATSEASGSVKSLSFRLAGAQFPAASASPTIGAAPATAFGPDTTWQIGGATGSKTVVGPVSPGRWYLVVTNNDSSEATVTINTQLSLNATAATALIPGNYYNPQRSGHGVFVSQAGGQQVLDWYTYLEDGTPAWYIGQNAAPAAGVGTWSSDLYRVTWDGATAAAQKVGAVVLTNTASDHAFFSWQLFGQTGSESFSLLAAPACVNVGGNSANLNGEWYPPAQSGYGFDALVLPGQQFDAFYLYDIFGSPRWVVGSNGPFAASSTVPMLQPTGFCPVCAYQALTTQAAGNLTVNYANATSGQLTTAITLNSPLGGTWNVSQAISRLTGSATCP